jgi:hypothetical protein
MADWLVNGDGTCRAYEVHFVARLASTRSIAFNLGHGIPVIWIRLHSTRNGPTRQPELEISARGQRRAAADLDLEHQVLAD